VKVINGIVYHPSKDKDGRDTMIRLGPAATDGATCACHKPAVFECQGCALALCAQCWNRHSHTTRRNGFAPGPAPDEQHSHERVA
jgi:hypothetical protein